MRTLTLDLDDTVVGLQVFVELPGAHVRLALADLRYIKVQQ